MIKKKERKEVRGKRRGRKKESQKKGGKKETKWRTTKINKDRGKEKNVVFEVENKAREKEIERPNVFPKK